MLRGKPGIVSTGGGAWMSAENRAQVAARGVSVWLDVPLGVLWNRVRQRPTRPLLQTPDPRGTLARLLAERAPSYALAEITVPVRAENSVDDTAARVLEAIRTHRPEILEPA